MAAALATVAVEPIREASEGLTALLAVFLVLLEARASSHPELGEIC